MYSWDENKNQSNQAKHGVSFELAQLVFDDPNQLSVQDRVENGEERWQTLGRVGDEVLLLVAHTYWTDDGDEEHIRIISARSATKQERKIYEQGP